MTDSEKFTRVQNDNLKHFIWINGPINSGKTTISNLLQIRINNSINIELDTLSAFERNLPIDNKLKFIIQDGIDLAKNWAERKFIPILNWPIYGEELSFMLNYSRVKELKPFLFNLTPNYEVVKTNRGARDLIEWELERIDYMYKVCKMDKPQFGHSIDNSHLTPYETVSLIEKILNQTFVDK